ncbi:MAG TPA: hypothetical protein VGM69_23055 [Chloroflexota bacterium]
MAVAGRAGLPVVERRALYIEAFLNWLARGDDRYDLLQRRLNRPAFRPLMARLMDAGNLWPRHAWNLLFACRKAT